MGLNVQITPPETNSPLYMYTCLYMHINCKSQNYNQIHPLLSYSKS